MRLRQSASNTVWTIMPCCALLLDRPLRCERAADYESGGLEFESLRERQYNQ